MEALCVEVLCSLVESFGDYGTASNTETVVVEFEDGEAVVVLEEVDHGLGRSATESIVGQIDLYKAGVVGESIAEGTESVRNLCDESAGEDVGKVGDFERLLVLQDISESLACIDTERVAAKMNLFEVGDLFQLFEVGLNVGLGVEFEAMTYKGEDFGLVRHIAEVECGG